MTSERWWHTIESNVLYRLGNLGKRILLITGDDFSIWRRFTKNVSISLGGSITLIAIALGRTALLIKSLKIDDYGTVLIVINLFAFLGAFLGVRVNDVICRFYPPFEQKKDTSALRGLFFLCFALSLGVGLAIGGGVFILASWIADRFYQDTSLVALLRIYAGASLLLTFEGFYTSILRLNDRFAVVVIPQVLGGATTLALSGGYLYFVSDYRLELVIGTIVLGIVIQTVPPMIRALQIVKPYLGPVRGESPWRALSRYRQELLSTLFQTNLVGYLGLFSDTGGLFLLGVSSTPEQVALYGLARQLTQPLLMLQNNLQVAITPEIVSFWVEGKVKSLYQLVKHFTMSGLVLGGVAVVIASLLVRPVILLVAEPQYLDALPIFYVLIVTAYLTFSSLTFYSVALVLDRMKRRNIVVAFGLLYIAIAAVMELNALNLAIARLIGTVTIRLFNDFPLFKHLHRLSRPDTLPMDS